MSRHNELQIWDTFCNALQRLHIAERTFFLLSARFLLSSFCEQFCAGPCEMTSISSFYSLQQLVIIPKAICKKKNKKKKKMSSAANLSKTLCEKVAAVPAIVLKQLLSKDQGMTRGF